MKHTLLTLALALACAVAPASATIAFTTNPSGGAISVTPGSTNGWGFTFTTTDSNYYVLSGVEFCIGAAIPGIGACNSTPVGTFTDFASAVNGLIIGPAYSASPYSEVFNNSLLTGLGSFTASSGAAVQTIFGTLFVYYDLYGGDPANGGTQFTGSSVSSFAQVNIVSANGPVPEPSSILLVSLAGAALLLRRRAK